MTLISQVASSTSSSSSLSTSTSAVEQQITVSGAVVTQFITAVATAAAESSSAAIINESSTSSHLSKGASAGIAIGAIIAAALLGLLFFFCCGRRRGRSGDDESGLNRNTSVLSKAGLLRNTSAKRGPKLQTAGLAGQGGAENPMSATTAMTMSTSRDSRPVFVDQRLNPNAWVTHHPNASQSTLGSLHDHRDYSRPLEVCTVLPVRHAFHKISSLIMYSIGSQPRCSLRPKSLSSLLSPSFLFLVLDFPPNCPFHFITISSTTFGFQRLYDRQQVLRDCSRI